jgi:hypothetical protein
MYPGLLDRTDVHEDIVAAVIRLNESVALFAIESLLGSLSHMLVFLIVPPRGDPGPGDWWDEIRGPALRLVRASARPN